MRTVIVDLGIGNVGSVKTMLRKLGVDAEVTSSAEGVEKAERLVVPGVGSFGSGMQSLRDLGLVAPLTRKVMEQRVPILGICLGMQLFTLSSEEGGAEGLGWVNAHTRKFSLKSRDLKVPHMGWNFVKPSESARLFKKIDSPWRFYFVHSFHVEMEAEHQIEASCKYGDNFVCAFGVDNIYGVQFHPEKSHKYGLELFRNFLEV